MSWYESADRGEVLSDINMLLESGALLHARKACPHDNEMRGMIARKEYYLTSVPNLLAKSEFAQKTFEGYYNARKVLDLNRLMLYKGFLTRYEVNKAVEFGEVTDILVHNKPNLHLYVCDKDDVIKFEREDDNKGEYLYEDEHLGG